MTAPTPDALLAELRKLDVGPEHWSILAGPLTTGSERCAICRQSWPCDSTRLRTLLPAVIARLEAGPCVHLPLSHEPMPCGHCPCEQVQMATDPIDQRSGPCSCCESEERVKAERDGAEAEYLETIEQLLAALGRAAPEVPHA